MAHYDKAKRLDLASKASRHLYVNPKPEQIADNCSICGQNWHNNFYGLDFSINNPLAVIPQSPGGLLATQYTQT
jgi:hypothetical protein